MAPLEAKRIMVYGVTGSGKTTYARKVAERLGRDWVSVDDQTWMANWEQVPDDEQRRIFTEICARDEWILDTAYGKWVDIPLARVELILALDYPRWLSLARLVRRTLMRAIDKEPVCNGNTETWRLMFSRESIIAWHFRSFKNKRRRIHLWANDPDKPEVIIFRHPREAEAWLNSLPPKPD